MSSCPHAFTGAALFLSSKSHFYQNTFEYAMQAAMQGVSCRNSWDGFGVCLEATNEYNDGSPNLVTDEQFERFLQGGPAAYTDAGPQTLLWLTQSLEAQMNSFDISAANGGNALTRSERLGEVRRIFKQPSLHLPVKAAVQYAGTIPSGLRCHVAVQTGSGASLSAPECRPGYHKRSVCGTKCEPCPPGYHAEVQTQFNSSGLIQTVWQCRRCPFGTYQSAPGKLACVTCPNALFSTGRAGATSKDECTVPNYEFRPTLPLGCVPPACTEGPTAVNVFWTLLGSDSPDNEQKTVAVRIFMQLSWSDPRIALHPSLGSTLNAQSIQPGGVRQLTVTTATWRELGMWLPTYGIQNAQSGLYGPLLQDGNVQLSNITLIQRPLAEEETKQWASQLYWIECVWSRQLGDTSGGGEPAVMSWGNLDWYMYPFGTSTMKVDLGCAPGVACELSSQAARGAFAYEGAISIQGRDPPAGRRLAVKGGAAATALSAAGGAGDDWPTAMPLVDGSVIWEVLDEGSPSPVFRVSFTLSRSSMLQLVRLIIPTVLIMLLGVTVFYVADSTWTVEMTFNVLLVVSVISVEVKDFFPSHVTYMSWMDWFVLSNLMIIVLCCFLGLICIIAGESESEFYKRLDESLDESISSTQPVGALVINIMLICAGSMGGGPDSVNGPGAGSRIDNIKNIVVTFFICDLVVLAVTFAAKMNIKASGGGKGAQLLGMVGRMRMRYRERREANQGSHPTMTKASARQKDAITVSAVPVHGASPEVVSSASPQHEVL